ncbi:hypothetical protein ACIB24_14245 [Spongisporangium articulatum]|uniref:Uncharacterized protein n=1 Tax=Spongisporangium articulatum TaxID=3362603 RepID=A0ABW8APB8_9ACTN
MAALPDAGPVTDPPEQHVAQPVSRGKTRTSVDDAEPPERVRPAAQPVTDATVARPDPQTASDVDHAQTQNFPVDHAQTHDAFAHDHGGDAAFVHDQRGEWLRGDREEVEEVEEVGAAVARLVAWRPELRIADPQHWSRGGRHVAPPATPSQRTGWRAGQVLLPGAPANDT